MRRARSSCRWWRWLPSPIDSNGLPVEWPDHIRSSGGVQHALRAKSCRRAANQVHDPAGLPAFDKARQNSRALESSPPIELRHVIAQISPHARGGACGQRNLAWRGCEIHRHKSATYRTASRAYCSEARLPAAYDTRRTGRLSAKSASREPSKLSQFLRLRSRRGTLFGSQRAAKRVISGSWEPRRLPFLSRYFAPGPYK